MKVVIENSYSHDLKFSDLEIGDVFIVPEYPTFISIKVANNQLNINHMWLTDFGWHSGNIEEDHKIIKKEGILTVK